MYCAIAVGRALEGVDVWVSVDMVGKHSLCQFLNLFWVFCMIFEIDFSSVGNTAKNILLILALLYVPCTSDTPAVLNTGVKGTYKTIHNKLLVWTTMLLISTAYYGDAGKKVESSL